MRLVLFQPEIPSNTGTLLRLGACLDVGIDLIEPLGFLLSERRLKRAGMDYMEVVDYTVHASWNAFYQQKNTKRCILLKAHSSIAYTDFLFQKDDFLILGQESQGVPPEVEAQCTESISIPMNPRARSLNVAVAAAMVIGEALRQHNGFPKKV